MWTSNKIPESDLDDAEREEREKLEARQKLRRLEES